MVTLDSRSALRRGTWLAVAALTCALAAPAIAYGQAAAATAYQRALARERSARKVASPRVATLRAIATSYEAIVRRYPRSTYCDDALWQGAGVLQLAYERGHATRDRDNAARLLRWLKKEYPHSTFAKQTDAKIASLTSKPAAATAASRPAPAPRVTPEKPAVEKPTPETASAPASPPRQPVAPPKPTTTTVSAETPAAGESAPVAASATVRATSLAPLPEVFREFPVTLRDAKYSSLPHGERLTIELTQEVAHTIDRSSNQERVFLALPGVGITPALVDAVAKIHGTLLQDVRISPRVDGILVSLDVTRQTRYSTFPLYDPYRIVVDLDTDDGASASAAMPAPSSTVPIALKTVPVAFPGVTAASTPKLRDAVPATPPAPTPLPASPTPPAAPPVSAAPETQPLPPASTRAGGYSLARQLGLGVQRIVIDPGHGGHDPGAQANGVSEAELVLDVSKRLEALLLAQPGVEVVLTRRTNEFIPLEERTAIANREGADLFLSIHANSSPQRDTRGVETYFLNFASNPQAEVVAARENASSVQAMGGLPQLVKAITLNNKLTESRELATLVQSSLMRRLSVQNKAIKDLGVKQAPFVVLIGAQMPSVLAEISFLTNKAEASLLKQDAYRQRIAQALCDAVLKYQSSLKKVGTVAANIEAR
jgi:N-acetylmuramoyl-L-alanine amidase